MRHEIRFILNDREITVTRAGPSDTMLDYLRLDRGLRGTKEGCAEGDCGACTVLVGRLYQGMLCYETVNSCIRLLPSIDGCHVVTIEYLRGPDGGLNPVQQALVDLHGSQCGFCTPGIVMSLYALWMENPDPDEIDVEKALQGNLCRCTGYEPIVKAALLASRTGDPSADVLAFEREAITQQLHTLNDKRRVDVARDGVRAILPASADDLAQILLDETEATIVAGATDVGLWITKFMRDISPAVFIGHLEDLKFIEVDETRVTIGAGVTYHECEPVLVELFPHLEAFWPRIGGQQVRNMGTIGGNIANGSPIGDTPPVLISLGADITLRQGESRRTVLLEDFFIDYGRQDRAGSEFVESISIPRLPSQAYAAAYKISKRRDEDISSVCCGCVLTLDDGVVASACLAYGGMAATPKRARAAEEAILGKPWSRDSIHAAVAALETDFTPISDWRASARYRALVAGNLLYRFFEETAGNALSTNNRRAAG